MQFSSNVHSESAIMDSVLLHVEKTTTCTDVFADVFQTGMKFFKMQDLSPNQDRPISGIGCGRKRQSHLWRARETRKLGLPGGEQFGGRCGWKTSGEFSHLGCIKPCKSWDRLPTSTAWCKVSSIHRIKM